MLVCLRPEYFPEVVIAKAIRVVLAGYASEVILTGDDTDEVLEREKPTPGHDFYKALTMLTHAYRELYPQGEYSNELIIWLTLEEWFREVAAFLQNPVVWSATELVARRLMQQRHITRNNGIFELRDEIYRIPGFESLAVHVDFPQY